MPNYDYQCTDCGHKEEILQKITEEPLSVCPQCGKATFKRKFGLGIGLQFHGSGFYATDYKGGNSGGKPSSGTSGTSSSSSDNSSPPSTGGCGCGKSSCSD